MLAFNHAYLTPASSRPEAFGEKIQHDSKLDNVVLVTTWDLFRLMQKMLAGEMSPEQVRTHLSQAGRVQV